MHVDYLIVGSGLTGATIARMLHDAGREVLVLDRRTHLGGNVHDTRHESGIRIHTYGPHYFRTSSDKLWEWVQRFDRFYKFEAVIKSWVDERYENWPIAASYIRQHVGENWSPEFKGAPANFEEASLALMPRLVYEKFVKGYSEKQWGVPATELSASLSKRFDVRLDDEPRLMRHKYQGLPLGGYTGWMARMLEGIPVRLGVDYLKCKDEFQARKGLVFTGPIDEFFGFDLGRLKYRGQRRETRFEAQAGLLQPCGQVNNPDLKHGPHIRTLEWKHMLAPGEAERIAGSVVTRETTYTPTDPEAFEYPFPDDVNAKLNERYQVRAAAMPNLLICGRLGEYRYYDMDQAIARAMTLGERLLKA